MSMMLVCMFLFINDPIKKIKKYNVKKNNSKCTKFTTKNPKIIRIKPEIDLLPNSNLLLIIQITANFTLALGSKPILY